MGGEQGRNHQVLVHIKASQILQLTTLSLQVHSQESVWHNVISRLLASLSRLGTQHVCLRLCLCLCVQAALVKHAGWEKTDLSTFPASFLASQFQCCCPKTLDLNVRNMEELRAG